MYIFSHANVYPYILHEEVGRSCTESTYMHMYMYMLVVIKKNKTHVLSLGMSEICKGTYSTFNSDL